MTCNDFEAKLGAAVANLELAKRDVLSVFEDTVLPQMIKDEDRRKWCQLLIMAQLRIGAASREVEAIFDQLKFTGGPVR